MNKWDEADKRAENKRDLCIKQTQLIAKNLKGTWYTDLRHFDDHPNSSSLTIMCKDLNTRILISWMMFRCKGMKVEASAYVLGEFYDRIGFSIDRNAKVLAKDI